MEVRVRTIKYYAGSKSTAYYQDKGANIVEIISKVLTSEITGKYSHTLPIYIEIKELLNERD